MKEQVITFDSESFNAIKKMFGLKNLKCAYCDKKITKNNVAGFLSAKEVFCNDTFCLLEYIQNIERSKKPSKEKQK
jgi:hypothetical protein